MDEELRIEKKEELEIDLVELSHLIFRKLWMIVLCAILGAAVAAGVTKFLMTPLYTATSTIYILTKTTSVTSIADLQLGNQLTADFELLAKTRPVVEEVINTAGVDMNYSQLVGKVVTNNPAESHLLRFTITDADPAMAERLANAYADVMVEQIADIMNTDKPNIAERAVEPQVPSSPNVSRNTMLGGILGAAVMCALIFIGFIMNDTIETEEDVRKYLGLHTLAAMPLEKRRK